jgi:ATP-binding cassette, subfamily B, bacterial
MAAQTTQQWQPKQRNTLSKLVDRPSVCQYGGLVELGQLVRNRLALLRLLRLVPTSAVAWVAAAMVAVSAIPAATALAIGSLIGRAKSTAAGTAPLHAVWLPLGLACVLLTVDQLTGALINPVRSWLDMRINGGIRRVVRDLLGSVPGVDHLERQTVRAAATLPVENTYLFNLGAGVEGQLWLLARFTGAILAAIVVGVVSLPAALAATGFTVWQRALLRRHYAGAIAKGMTDTLADVCAGAYWADVLGGARYAKEVRLFGFAPHVVDDYSRHARRPADELARVLLSAFPLHWKVFALNGLAASIPFGFLLWEATHGTLPAVSLATAIGGVFAVIRLIGPMGFEAFSIEAAVPQLAALDALRVDMSEQAASSKPSPEPGLALTQADHRQTPAPLISFDHVEFTYAGSSEPVLRDVHLTLQPGESVAIVGENGAGKTTLLKLLAGFYQPTKGRITIDGVDLRDLNPVEWRRRLAAIMQDFTRFELSAFENIALADPTNHDAMNLAVRAAVGSGAAEIIEALPHGWDTVLASGYTNGTELSGGQWQRIALARALYAADVGGQVLVLDEPTASLDVHAETELFDRVLAHSSHCTIIVVSHRYSTVRRADRIVVLGNGTIIEDGSHRELMALGGTYETLYTLQASQFRET